MRDAEAGARPHIIYPHSGTILALDPDIPARHRRVWLQMRPERAGFVWGVDGRRVAVHDGETPWRPRHARTRSRCKTRTEPKSTM
ncbi:MAG TPA: hypothetical protein VFM11_07545 [Burkholderiales bacterium]|nr:hypothetical protein [Burkholderiales bacterium]